MSDWITVSRTEHAKYGYLPLTDYRFSASMPIVSLLVSELSQALSHYVLGFVKRGESFHLVALLGQRKGSHLYLHPDGRWLGSYIPAALRGYPFTLARTDKGDPVLQLRATHMMSVGGDRIFDDNGELTDGMQQRVEFLRQCEMNRQVTHRGCKALGDAGVLVPWDEGSANAWAKGLYRFDELKLNEKDPATFHGLRGVPLAIAYAQMFSMTQVSELAQRARLLEEHDQRAASEHSSEGSKSGGTLDSLFGIGGSEDIRFN